MTSCSSPASGPSQPLIYWTAFADRRMDGTLKRITREAQAMDLFAGLLPRREADLDAAFMGRWGDFIKANRRGFGYWIWKPHIIQRALCKIPEGAFLLYTDAGCTLNREGRDRLVNYCRLLDDKGTDLLAFQLPLLERAWTKMDLLRRLNHTDPDAMASRQCLATTILIRNSPAGRRFINRWAEIAGESPHWIDDSPSVTPNAPEFSEHRHDQSVFSILAKQLPATILPDETWWPTEPWPRTFPVHATRIKKVRSLPVRCLRHVFRPLRGAIRSAGRRER